MNAFALAAWPTFPGSTWRATYDTLHLWTQIVGKTRLALAPMENHWWNVAFYVNARGFTTSAMPCGTRTLEIEFDFVAHRLNLRLSDGSAHAIALKPQSVADFYADYLRGLHALGVAVTIMASPVEVVQAIPFTQDHEHASYDADAAHRCWQILVQADRVFKRFRGRFIGKQSPAHFFWGSFDLASTRFSGRPAPRHAGGAPNCPDWVMVEAYSHECSSCGFWPGDGKTPPTFYAYAYPEPPGYSARPAGPAAAYSTQAREFLLPYDAVQSAKDPDAVLLEFMQATYEAAADLGAWDRQALERRAADWL